MYAVRSMQSDDIDQVYSIELSAHRAPWSRDILRDCVLVGYDCRVIEKAQALTKQVLGYIICRHSGNTCHILNLCIAPFAQGQGLGKFLLKTLLDGLVNSEIDTILLEVRPTNKSAIALYQAFGFYCDAIKKDYYQDQNTQEDALLLKKFLIRDH